MFVLQKGVYLAAKMDYSYGRRPQSVTETLHWKDVAVIDVESLSCAIAEAEDTIRQWCQQGYTADRWRVEGRGTQIQQSCEVSVE